MVSVGSLLESAQRIGTKLNEAGDVVFQVETSASEALLLVDRLQIELVLRNLIANAFEAIANCPRRERRITVSAQAIEGNALSSESRIPDGRVAFHAQIAVRAFFNQQTDRNGVGSCHQPGNCRSTWRSADHGAHRTWRIRLGATRRHR